MLPRWALGNFSSRFGYHSQEEVEMTIEKFKDDKIPVDAIILDLEDSIPYALKAEARQSLPNHIANLSEQHVDVVVRINYDMINAVED